MSDLFYKSAFRINKLDVLKTNMVKFSGVILMVEFLAVIGALALLFLAIKAFPALVSVLVGFGVIAVVVFIFLGLLIFLIPVLIVMGLILLIARLINPA